ncbi:MAG: 16S rRNA (guanine(527)-N(7))-methyltransferase RsmG [candidate division NC10 bacterium]|nr:16S rRNA (guanine(527)-N(7))-methyltransferase RsmG [candidate division NC10 bacterium]
MSARAPADLLFQGLRELGLGLGESAFRQLLVYADEVARWTRRVSLTGFKEPERIIRDGILRSLRLLPLLPERDRARLADVGSGAGFPGIPLKIARPGLDVTLIEASRRKASFLLHAIRLLGLEGNSCLRVRVEALGEKSGILGSFDAVTARALAPLPEAVALLTPLLAHGGILIVPQGKGPWSHDIPAGLRVKLIELIELKPTLLLPPETVAILRRADVSRETFPSS